MLSLNFLEFWGNIKQMSLKYMLGYYKIIPAKVSNILVLNNLNKNRIRYRGGPAEDA